MFTSTHTTAFSVHLPHTLYVSGYPLEGEVELDFRQLLQDNVEEIHVKLRGFAKTTINRDKSKTRETVELLRADVSLWTRGTAYPSPGSDTLRLRFQFELPPHLPPSFQYSTATKSAAVRYTVTAVGVRPGAFQFNRRVCVPIAIVPGDPAGVRARETLMALAAGVECPWRPEVREEKIRRGLWGEYATVHVELLMPEIAVRPLNVPIPFEIRVRTVSAPLPRAKADAQPAGKPVFPPPPVTFGMFVFKLRRHLYIRANLRKERSSGDACVFAWDPTSVLDVEVPEREWVPLEAPAGRVGEKGACEKGIGGQVQVNAETKGVWVQSSRFRSTIKLDCPPTFAIGTIECSYELALEVPFPGLGNNVHVTIPITIGSGLDAPVGLNGLGPSMPGAPRNLLDLPPAYWNDDDREWDDHKD